MNLLRQRFRRRPHQLLFFILIVTCVCVRAYSPPPFSQVVPGLDYLHVSETNHPWSIHIARLDRSRSDFEVLSALTRGKMVGLSSVASQAKALAPELGKPIVAINGDFFVIAKGPYQGDPLGLEITQGELISAPAGDSFWVDPDGKFALGTVRSRLCRFLAAQRKASLRAERRMQIQQHRSLHAVVRPFHAHDQRHRICP